MFDLYFRTILAPNSWKLWWCKEIKVSLNSLLMCLQHIPNVLCIIVWNFEGINALNSFPLCRRLWTYIQTFPLIPNIFVLWQLCKSGNTLKVCCPLCFSKHTTERRHGSWRSSISGAAGCPCLAVPCLGSSFPHCGLGVIINLLGLSRSPVVIWDCWVSICKGHDKAARW